MLKSLNTKEKEEEEENEEKEKEKKEKRTNLKRPPLCIPLCGLTMYP